MVEDNRNVIESVRTTYVTKKDLIELINDTFPDDEVGSYGYIGFITTTTMTDGTKMQTVCFGKIMNV